MLELINVFVVSLLAAVAADLVRRYAPAVFAKTERFLMVLAEASRRDLT